MRGGSGLAFDVPAGTVEAPAATLLAGTGRCALGVCCFAFAIFFAQSINSLSAERASFANFFAVFFACLNSRRAFFKRRLAARAFSLASSAALAEAWAVTLAAQNSSSNSVTAWFKAGFFIVQTVFLVRGPGQHTRTAPRRISGLRL